ncbi:MAG: metallophosphoesterase [Acidobacteria bacterium]|nr:metallophosphoesterase [Acidobacteriota bacterium]
MRILHISDLHFGAHSAAIADDLVSQVRKHNPDVVLATGDLADNPRRGHFSAARDFLDKLVKEGRSETPAS